MHVRLTRYLLLSAAILCFGVVTASLAEEDIASQQPERARFRTAKSHTGRFLVFGTNSVENLDLTRWAERIAKKFEDTVGMRPSYESGYAMRIVIGAEKSVAKAERRVTSRQDIIDGRMIPRLLIHGYSKVQTENVREEICRLFLDCMAGDILTERRGMRGTLTKADVSAFTVPSWVAFGLAQSLFSENRAKNGEKVVEMWSGGNAESLDKALSGDDPDPAVAGVFVDLLLTAPEPSHIFRLILARRADGQDVTPSWAARQHPVGATFSSTEAMWKDWLERQTIIIYRPGFTPSFMYEKLAKALVLYPRKAELASPLDATVPDRISLRDVLIRRKETWAKELCYRKSLELGILSAGRGKEFCAVVELYAKFLRGMSDGEKEKQLKDSLEAADFAWAELLEDVARPAAEKDASVGVEISTGQATGKR